MRRIYNCIDTTNEEQADTDNDTIADGCDDCDNLQDPLPVITTQPYHYPSELTLSANASNPTAFTADDLVVWTFTDAQPRCCLDPDYSQGICSYKHPGDPDNGTIVQTGISVTTQNWATCIPGGSDGITDNRTYEVTVKSIDCLGQETTLGGHYLYLP